MTLSCLKSPHSSLLTFRHAFRETGHLVRVEVKESVSPQTVRSSQKMLPVFFGLIYPWSAPHVAVHGSRRTVKPCCLFLTRVMPWFVWSLCLRILLFAYVTTLSGLAPRYRIVHDCKWNLDVGQFCIDTPWTNSKIAVCLFEVSAVRPLCVRFVFWTVHFQCGRPKINQQNAQINSGFHCFTVHFSIQ